MREVGVQVHVLKAKVCRQLDMKACQHRGKGVVRLLHSDVDRAGFRNGNIREVTGLSVDRPIPGTAAWTAVSTHADKQHVHRTTFETIRSPSFTRSSPRRVSRSRAMSQLQPDEHRQSAAKRDSKRASLPM